MENFIYYVGFICIWCFVFLLPLILIRIVVFIENIISFFKDLVKIRKEWLENEKNGSIDEINNNLSSLADFILDSVLDADFNLLILNLFGVALVTVLKYLISDKTKSLEKN